jgi:hypothetical protein
MSDSSALFASESVIPVLIFAPICILWGAFLVWAALTDPGGWFTAWFEGNKDQRGGFWAVSRNSVDFRGWHFVLGAGFVGGGIVGLVWAL